MSMIFRRCAWPAALVLALAAGALLPKCEGPGPHPFTRAALTTSTCPAGLTCLSNVDVTDRNGLGAALIVHDYMGNPMWWVDTFQADSSNPVCAVAVKTPATPYLAREACLGGPPFDASGGHPVVSLWDGQRWQTLTARDIAWLHRAEQLRPGW